MTGPRVLRVYHSAVVPEYRERDRLLRERHGYDVHLACPAAWSEGGRRVTAVPDEHVPLHILPTAGREHPILFWYRVAAMRHLIRTVRPGIIDLHEEPYSLAVTAALTAATLERTRVPVCLYTAQNILKRYPLPVRLLERRALRRAAAIYPCSTEAADVARAKGFTGDVEVLPLGVTVRDRPERHFSATPLRVGFVGRLERYKGAHIALEAFALAARDLPATLEVVGAGTQLAALRARAAALGVAERVTFTGAIEQPAAVKRVLGFDALLIPSLTTPSWKEQFGRIAVEGLETGTPVIASDSGSLREVLGDCGVLVPEGDVSAFAAALEAVLRSPERRAEMSSRGRVRAKAAYSWESVADGFDRMYSALLTPSRVPAA